MHWKPEVVAPENWLCHQVPRRWAQGHCESGLDGPTFNASLPTMVTGHHYQEHIEEQMKRLELLTYLLESRDLRFTRILKIAHTGGSV